MTNAANAVVDVLGEALIPKQTIINIPPPPHTPGGQLPNNAPSADANKTLRINANASGKNVLQNIPTLHLGLEDKSLLSGKDEPTTSHDLAASLLVKKVILKNSAVILAQISLQLN